MKQILTACAALAATLALAACGTPSAPRLPPPTPPPVATTGQPSTTVVDQAYFAALTAYNIPAQAYRTLDQRNQLPAEIKAQAKDALVLAYNALVLAKELRDKGDLIGALFQSNEAKRLSAAAKRLLPSNQ